jgi:translation initiation factor 3 subunit D
MTARFNTPVIQDNPTGWGPNTIPSQFKDMPYQPFSKADRLGKVSIFAPGNLLAEAAGP